MSLHKSNPYMSIYKSFVGALFLAITFTFCVTAVMSESPLTPPITSPIPPSPSPTPAIVYQWISFGPLGKPAVDSDTAAEILSTLNTEGIKAYEIDRWFNGGWSAHYYNLPFNDFPVIEGNGYMIKVNQIDLSQILKILQYTNVGYLKYGLIPGWNYISIPQQMINIIGHFNSEDVCRSINRQGGTAQIVKKWENGRTQEDWKEYTCGSNRGTFTVGAGQGYMVKSSSSSSWEPVRLNIKK